MSIRFQTKRSFFIIRPQNLKYPIYVPITYSAGNNTVLLPARSQVIRKIDINIDNDYILVPNQVINNGIYVTIEASKNVYIRLLNTTNFNQLVKMNKVKYENLSDYNIHNTNPKIEAKKYFQNYGKIFQNNLKNN